MNLISIPAFQDNYIWVLVEMNVDASLSIPEKPPGTARNRRERLAAGSHSVDASP
jgi:hypothetical protein